MTKIYSSFVVNRLDFKTRHIKKRDEKELIILDHNLDILSAFERVKSVLVDDNSKPNILYFDAKRKLSSILSIEFDGKLIRLVVKLSNKNSDAPSLTDFDTLDTRETEKSENDGGDTIGRVLIKINDDSKYLSVIAIENKNGITKVLFHKLITHYLKIHATLNPITYTLPHPSNVTLEDGSKETMKIKHFAHITGCISDQIKDAIENDEVVSFLMTETIPQRQHDGTDILPLHHKILSFKPELNKINGSKLTGFIRKIKELASGNSTNAANSKYKLEYFVPNTTKIKTVEINPFSDNLTDAFTHKIYVDITQQNIGKYDFPESYSKNILNHINSEIENRDDKYSLESFELLNDQEPSAQN